MSGRFWPLYLIAAVFGTAGSAGAGLALGSYAAGGINPFYTPTRLATLELPPEPHREPTQLAAVDLASQWPVGSGDADGLSDRR